MAELEANQIADQLHDAMLRALANIAPVGGDRSVPTNAVADALITLLAELLTATRPADLPAAEIEVEVARLAALFRQRLEQAIADRSGPIGHA